MEINKDYIKALRAGKRFMDVEKQNEAGFIVGMTIVLCAIILIVAIAGGAL